MQALPALLTQGATQTAVAGLIFSMLLHCMIRSVTPGPTCPGTCNLRVVICGSRLAPFWPARCVLRLLGICACGDGGSCAPQLHWDPATETFADYGNHTEDVSPSAQLVLDSDTAQGCCTVEHCCGAGQCGGKVRWHRTVVPVQWYCSEKWLPVAACCRCLCVVRRWRSR